MRDSVSMTWAQYRHAECRFRGKLIQFTRMEADVLAVLLLRRGIPVSSGDLIEALYPSKEPDAARNCVRVYIHRLRRKLPGLIRKHDLAWGNGFGGYVIDRP